MHKSIRALLIAGLLPLSVAESLAATGGTINLTGRVADGTCTITDMNQSVVLPTKTASEASKMPHGAVLSTVRTAKVNISDCPSGMSQAKVRYDFDAEADGRSFVLSADSVPGISFNFYHGSQTIRPGDEIVVPLTSGKAEFSGDAYVYRNVNDATKGKPAETIPPGSYNSTLNVSLSFE